MSERGFFVFVTFDWPVSANRQGGAPSPLADTPAVVADPANAELTDAAVTGLSTEAQQTEILENEDGIAREAYLYSELFQRWEPILCGRHFEV